MEPFILMFAFLATIMAAISLPGLVLLFVQNADLRRNLRQLEERVVTLEAQPPPSTLSPTPSQASDRAATRETLPDKTSGTQPVAAVTSPESKSADSNDDVGLEPPSVTERSDDTRPDEGTPTQAEHHEAPSPHHTQSHSHETDDLEADAASASAQEDAPEPVGATAVSGAAHSQPPRSPDTVDDGSDPEPRGPSESPDAAQSAPTPDATPKSPTTSAAHSSPGAATTGGSLEKALGSTVAVWGGATALALAAAMLVQYGIQNAVLSPSMRVALGGAVSLLMVIGGELAFRRLRLVGGGLVGAGIVGLYATFGAATALYDMLSPLLAMGLMILTTLTAAFLSIRHRLLIIAVIGLIGGFLTPLLVSVGSDSPLGFLFYLLVLHCGVVAVVRWRHWPSLLLMAAGMTFIAEMGWLLRGPREVSWSFIILAELLMIPGVLASTLGIGLLSRTPAGDSVSTPSVPEDQTWSARWGMAASHPWARINLLATIIPTMVVLATAAVWWRYPAGIWWTQALPGALALGLVMSHRHHLLVMPLVACGVVLFQQWVYLIDINPSHTAALQVFLNVAALYVGGLVIIALQRPRRMSAAASAIIIALIHYLMALLHAMAHTDGEFSASTALYWGMFTAMLGGGFALSAWGAHRRHLATLDDDKDNDDKPAAASRTLSSGASLFMLMAIFVSLEGNALTLTTLAYVAVMTASARVTRHDEPTGVGLMALALVSLRLLLPLGVHDLTGALPLLNWIAPLYGSAIAVTLWSGWHLDRTGRWSGGATLCIRLLGLAFFLAWITLEIRHFYHPDWIGDLTRAEQLTYSISWASVGFGALLYGLWRRSAVSRWVSLVLIGGTALKVFLLDLSFLDGLWRVASLAALGVVLIALATLYRLYVFPDEDDKRYNDAPSTPRSDDT